MKPSHLPKRPSSQGGFTLTELVVTVAVVGVVAAVAAINTGRRDAHARTAVLDAAAPALSKASRVVNYSDASPADAIALSLPPEVRGRVVINPVLCSALSATERDSADELCDVSFSGNSSYYLFYAGANLKVLEIKVEVLRAGNPPFFEKLATSYVPLLWPTSNGHSTLAVCRAAGANVTTKCTADCTSIPKASPINLMNNSSIVTKVQQVSGYVAGVTPLPECDTVGSGWAGQSYCYYNGTCDPVTYWFLTAPHSKTWVRTGNISLSRISLSYTGSIARYNSW